MKYYAEHELAYQRLLAKGAFGWDNKRSIDELLKFSYAQELELAFKDVARGGRVLDLGCGTGPTSFFLSRLGFNLTGLDISRTAIDKAVELKRKLGLEPEFLCDDFLEIDLGESSFDVIVDSSFLHCIVFDSDRDLVLRKFRSLLRNKGRFILHTMTSDKLFDFGHKFEFGADGILWYLSEKSSVNEAREVAHGVASPQRRILPSDLIRRQLHDVGLVEVSSQHLYYTKSASPASLFGVFEKV